MSEISDTSRNMRAFPREGYAQEGMDLRDYFAGQALVGLTGSDAVLMAINKMGGSASQQFAVTAYGIANAMLKARKALETSHE